MMNLINQSKKTIYIQEKRFCNATMKKEFDFLGWNQIQEKVLQISTITLLISFDSETLDSDKFQEIIKIRSDQKLV